MQGKTAQLEGGQELTAIQQKDFNNGTLLQRIIDAVNSVAQNLGAAAVGKLTPPPPLQSVSVQGTLNTASNTLTVPTNTELLHWVLNHTQPVVKGVQYFSEIDTNKNFTAPHVYSHGASRSGFLHLPTFLSDGVTQQPFYLRSYAQYPGSDAHEPVVFGGLASPTKIQMNGITALTFLQSTGSGTAAANGSQGGQGLGTSLVRSQPGPKRQLSA